MKRVDLGRRYRALRRLGAGGTGTVFLVRDEYLGREVALKWARKKHAGLVEAEELMREFALLSELEHPRLVRVHDFGSLRGRPFFTSDYVPGGSLGSRDVSNDAERLALAARLAEALAFLHRSGLLHLDLKPANIIVRTDHGKAEPVLIDFGLFRRGFPNRPGVPLRGSLPFLAPECFQGGLVGPWTDVFAFGVTFFWRVTGRFPHRGGEDLEAQPRFAAKNGVRARSAGVQRSPEFMAVLNKCLALDPRSRYASADELFCALKRIEGCPPVERCTARSPARTVGREADLVRVDQFIQGLVRREDSNPVLAFTGPPGMGHSHFLRLIKARSQTRGLRFYLETGHPGRASVPASLLACLACHLDKGAAEWWAKLLQRLRRPQVAARNETLDAERRLRRSREVLDAVAALEVPLVLAVDGLQFWDEISIEIVVDLARCLLEEKREQGLSLALVLGYREEGRAAPLLRELSSHILKSSAPLICLGPLSARETIELHRLRGGIHADTQGLGLHQETGGVPTRIAALTPVGRPPTRRSSSEPDDMGVSTAHLSRDERRLAAVLHLVKRPATVQDLAHFAGMASGRTAALLAGLEQRGLAFPEKDALWTYGPGPLPHEAILSDRERRRAHGKIASILQRGATARRGAFSRKPFAPESPSEIPTRVRSRECTGRNVFSSRARHSKRNASSTAWPLSPLLPWCGGWRSRVRAS